MNHDESAIWRSQAQFRDARRSSRPVGAVLAWAFLIIAGFGAVEFLSRSPKFPAAAAFLGATPAIWPMTAIAALLFSIGIGLLMMISVRSSVREQPGAADAAVVWTAGWPQSLLLAAGAAAAMMAAAHGWAAAQNTGMASPHGLAVAQAVICLALAFAALVVERSIAAMAVSHLPEAPGLAAVLRLAICICLAEGFLISFAASGVWIPLWLWRIPCLLAGWGAAELLARAILPWFAPPPSVETARVPVGCLIARDPRDISPRRCMAWLRDAFGIDFMQSWALRYCRTAIPVVSAGLLLLAWGLTGLARIDPNQRGVYERFGAPVRVLEPGLHLLLPSPFGRVRVAEFGVVHALVLADEAAATQAPMDQARAEDTASEAANRLWDGSAPDVSYLVARDFDGRPSFESISLTLRILYRIRPTAEGAMDALYRVSDPELLLRAQSRWVVAHFFASQTLDGVLGAHRDKLADALWARLQAALDQKQSGVEIVALVVDSIHPPIGAAKAYRQVQAAEIIARTSVAEERGRAEGTIALAQRDAHDLIASAQATAAEMIEKAKADAILLRADQAAYKIAGRGMLTERYLANMRKALTGLSFEILDSRLAGNWLDMRDGASSSGVDINEFAIRQTQTGMTSK